jgi:hypothetical protein
LGVRADTASIASIQITSEPDAGGFAFSDLTYGLADPAPPIALFVHGYGADFRDVGFELLLDDLRARYGIERVPVFQHYQDAGYRDEAGSCDPQAPGAILPEEPNDGMPVDLASIDPDLCDSWADLALNALMLEADIQERYHSSGAQTVLIANSMGAAIVRGMLSYSSKRGDGVAASMVDSVVFLEGAHDGWSCPAFVDTSTLGQRVRQLGPNDTSSRTRPATAGR